MPVTFKKFFHKMETIAPAGMEAWLSIPGDHETMLHITRTFGNMLSLEYGKVDIVDQKFKPRFYIYRNDIAFVGVRPSDKEMASRRLTGGTFFPIHDPFCSIKNRHNITWYIKAGLTHEDYEWFRRLLAIYQDPLYHIPTPPPPPSK